MALFVQVDEVMGVVRPPFLNMNYVMGFDILTVE
jgi:hypothetical protein